MNKYEFDSGLRRTDKRQRPISFKTITAAALLVALCGCGFAPREQTPVAPLSAAWKTAAPQAGWVNADEARAWQAGLWWELFGDAELSALMQRVNIHNQNLALAAANVAQAEALLRQPLGVTIIGGLVASQLLTLLTTPVVYVLLDKLRRRHDGEAHLARAVAA